MDATALRWVLAIIGVVCIAGIYLYTTYQNRLRRRAAIKTFTSEELEQSFIEDETLREELSNIHTMLEEELDEEEITDIKINPGLEAETQKTQETKPDLELPEAATKLLPDNLIAHVLKRDDDRLFTSEELLEALQHTAFMLDDDNYFVPVCDMTSAFRVGNMKDDGSFTDIESPEFCSDALVCFFDKAENDQSLQRYELMLKKIDELVRILDAKVYTHDLHLLTLSHVTELRDQLQGEPA